MVSLFHACVVVIARSYTWRGSFLREALLKRMLLFGLCPRRCTPLASMAQVFNSTWCKLHDYCWEETLKIMTEEWATHGWLVASVKVWKSGSSYQVKVEYEITWPETGKVDHFTEVCCKSPVSTWKPSYVTVLPSPGDTLIVGWWYKESSKAVEQLDQSMRQNCHIDEASAPAAMVTGDSISAAAAAAAVPEETILSDSEENSSSSLERLPKRMRRTAKSGAR